ncbi:hypothetical protein JB92DRAFT_2866577 [Gautieria morchelliformis]|nr:hypothetical protein JB92DRAFT_2866577 [Gautieria morchelliformis]
MLCSICLDTLGSPVVTPCGHVFCLDCLISSCQKSQDATKAPCPTCRTNFSLLSPNTIFIPEKYRQFIDSSVRRLYLDNSAEQGLQERVAQLEARVQSLETQKDMLMDRCESYKAASIHHAENEKDVRRRCTVLQKELRQANQSVAELVDKETRRMTVNRAGQPIPVLRPKQIDDIITFSLSSFEGHSLPTIKKRQSGISGPKVALPDSDSFRQIVPLPKRRRVTRQASRLGQPS